MPPRIEQLVSSLESHLGASVVSISTALDEATLVIKQVDLLRIMHVLRDHPDFKFEELIDVCGVDYATYGDGAWDGPRFAVVYHLLSLSHNRRLRVRIFADDDFPVVDSVVGLWPSA